MSLLRSHYGMCAKVAHGMGFSRTAVLKWPKIPAEYVVKVEEITGIDRSLLRPDLYLYVKAAEAPPQEPQPAEVS